MKKLFTLLCLLFCLSRLEVLGQGAPPFIRNPLSTNGAVSVPLNLEVPQWNGTAWDFVVMSGGGGSLTTNLIVSLSSTNGYFIYTPKAGGNSNAFFVLTNLPISLVNTNGGQTGYIATWGNPNATWADPAASGTTPAQVAAQISTNGNAVATAMTNPANAFTGSFTGNGGGLTNLNAVVDVDEIKIGFIGDSITAGVGSTSTSRYLTNANVASGAAIEFMNLSNLNYSITTYSNAAVTGSNIGDWQAGSSYLTNAINGFVSLGINTVSVMLGINNAITNTAYPPNVTGVSNQFVALATNIFYLSGGTIKRVIFNAPYYITSDTTTDHTNKNNFTSALMPVFAALPTVVSNVYLGDTNLFAFVSNSSSLFLTDGTHPAERGHQIMGVYWFQALVKSLSGKVSVKALNTAPNFSINGTVQGLVSSPRVNGASILTPGNTSLFFHESGNSLFLIATNGQGFAVGKNGAAAAGNTALVRFPLNVNYLGTDLNLGNLGVAPYVGAVEESSVNNASLIFGTYPAGEVMRINSSGNASIGLTNVDDNARLTVAKSVAAGAVYLQVKNTAADAAGNEARLSLSPGSVFTTTSPSPYIAGYEEDASFNSALRLGVYPFGEAIRITSAGNVGIGITNPSVKFDVVGLVKASSGFTTVRSNGMALTAITFPANGVNWTNNVANTASPACNIYLHINNNGITGTALAKNGTTLSTILLTSDYILPMKPGDYFSETYSLGTPTGFWEPQ